MDPSRKSLRVFFVSFPFFILVSTTVLLWFWQSTSVRKLALEYAETYRPQLLEEALDDPSFEIREAACRRLIESGDGLRSERLLDRLVGEPKLAGACLGGIARRRETDDRPIALNYVPHHEVLAYRVSRRWFHGLLGEDDRSGAEPCLAANYLEKLSGLSHVPWRRQLFVTTFLGESAEARNCSVEVFGGVEAVVEWLKSSGGLEREMFGEHMVGLVAVAFSEQISPDGADGLPTHGLADLPAGIESVRLQDWIVDRTCQRLQGFDPHRMVVRAFMPVFEGSTCIDGRPPHSYYQTATWQRVCAETYGHHRRHELKAPPEALCGGLRDASFQRALAAASDEIYLAIRRQNPGVRKRSGEFDALRGPRPDELSEPSWALKKQRQQVSRSPMLQNFANSLMSPGQ